MSTPSKITITIRMLKKTIILLVVGSRGGGLAGVVGLGRGVRVGGRMRGVFVGTGVAVSVGVVVGVAEG